MNWDTFRTCLSRAFLFLVLWPFPIPSTAWGLAVSQPSAAQKRNIARSLHLLPLRFEPNDGQSTSDAKFLAQGRGFSALFKESETDILLAHRLGADDLLRVTLPNASRTAAISAESRLPGTVNYFQGNQPQNWHTGLPTFERLRYAGVYAGIDMIYYGNQGRMEFDFQVSPGADPKSIQMRLEGAQSVKLDHDGNLLVTLGGGHIAFKKPIIYQATEGKAKEPVAGSFKILGANTIGFAVAAYDHSRPLIIDPILNYSTYLGGFAEGAAIAVDQNGEAYITGVATSNFPSTTASYQPRSVRLSPKINTTMASGTPFVAKFNSTGTALLYSTFLGGSGVERANGIAVDANGDAFIVGTTSSTNFPTTTGALQTKNNAGTATGFVAEINSTGTSLLYSTYLGGSTWASVEGIALDGSGNAYLAGTTQDTNFPTTAGAYMTTPAAKSNAAWSSAFVAKVNPAGTALVYSTYLSGSGVDACDAIAVDSAGAAYVGGTTTSNNFPVTGGAAQVAREAKNEQAGFVTKLNAAGSALGYSTYLGGNDTDSVNAIALDAGGDVYATGSTNSSDFPITAGAFQLNIGTSYFGYPQENAFVTELNSSGSAPIYSTFLGGNVSLGPYADEGDTAEAIALDGQGMVYLAGMACTGDFPVTPGAFEPTNLDGLTTGECTAFLTKMNPTPHTPLLYSTFLGGTGNGDASDYFYGEGANGLALDSSDNVYLTGFTLSIDFPTTAGVIETPFPAGPSTEAFVTEFNAGEMQSLPIPTVTLTSNTSSVLVGTPVTFTATVQAASGSNAPTGYVGFNFFQPEASDDEGLDVGFGPWTTVALNGSGVATFTTSSLVYSPTPLNAFYLGDANNAPASGNMSQSVTHIPTTTTVTSNANNVPYGTPVVFTATVLDNTGKPAKGFVAFQLGNLGYATPTLDSNGQATWTNGTGGPPLPAGTDTVTVNFSPDIGYQQSVGTLAETFTVLGATPDPTVTPPGGTYSSTQQVTLADSSPTGVIYYTTDGSTPVPGVSVFALSGTTVSVNSSETLSAVAVATGYSPSNVVKATYTINLPSPGFTLSASSPALTVSSGQQATVMLTVTPQTGFNSAVSFSCSGLAAGASCAFKPANVTPAGAAVTTTLTITAQTLTAASRRNHRSVFPSTAFPGAALAFGLCLVGCRRRRDLRHLFLIGTVAAALGSTLGCGGGSGGGGVTGNPTAVTSAVTVTATSGSLQQTTVLSLTVN